MIAHKIGRILNGDPNYADSWIDIAGYAKLVADRLEKDSNVVVPDIAASFPHIRVDGDGSSWVRYTDYQKLLEEVTGLRVAIEDRE